MLVPVLHDGVGDIDAANESLRLNGLTVISGDLCVVKDKDGFVYNIERYCFSTPRNVELKLNLPSNQSNYSSHRRVGRSKSPIPLPNQCCTRFLHGSEC